MSNVLVTAEASRIDGRSGRCSPVAAEIPNATVQGRGRPAGPRQVHRPAVEFGRMEATASDPSVKTTYGMGSAFPTLRKVNALSTINIRVTLRDLQGRLRQETVDGPLPPGLPAVCEEFRKQPDALERAAELDARFGGARNLAAMPCTLRLPSRSRIPSTRRTCDRPACADARYDIASPARYHLLVEQLRKRGAIIYASRS